LCFEERRADLHDGFIGKDRDPFGDGPHVAGETIITQPLEECWVDVCEHLMLAKEVNGVAVEMEEFEVVQALLKACGDEVAAMFGEAAYKEFEGGVTGHIPMQVRRHHGQLVEVGGQRQMGFVQQ